MSLRSRITLLYITLVGGILLLFGVAVYVSVSVTATQQVDATLRKTATDILKNTRLDASGDLVIVPLPSTELPADVYVQLWDRQKRLRASPNTPTSRPLDPVGYQSSRPLFNDTFLGNVHLRVLTVPLQVGKRPVGILQVGAKLTIVDAIQQTLLMALASGTLMAISVAGLAAWFSTRQALLPLKEVTRLALTITRADDLSRRIPSQGLPADEVGQLINAFNQTLGRLENLFHQQRRFMADVGHELRTPLTVIKGNVALLRRMGCSDEESLNGIETEVDRLTRLVGDLLLLAQAEAGRLPLARQTVELDTLLLEALQPMRVLAGDKLTLKIGEIDQVLVCGDPDRLKQVLVNLIGNAIQYTPAGGQVIVSLGKTANQARLTVSDTGPGIPPEDMPHLFERFYRGEKSRTRSADGKGFGLGLSIAYWIVRNHGGRIEVNSAANKGTTFCVWLPLKEQNCSDPRA